MKPRFLLVALALGALVAAGCGDDGPDATGGTSGAPTCTVPGTEPATFGEGVLPASVPARFPLPEGAVVGSTLLDRANHRTEAALTVRQESPVVVQYYTVSLVSAGYVVDSSAGDPLGRWRIEFSRGDLRGSIDLQSGGSGVTAFVVTFNTC